MHEVTAEDSVPRLERFRDEHPEVTINPPHKLNPYWEGWRDGEFLARAYWLERLLDNLEMALEMK